MTRNRWLIALLLISWTLNVALAVSLYYRSEATSRPIHPFPRMERPFAPHDPMPIMRMFPPAERESIRVHAMPLLSEQRRLAQELLQKLTSDELDTAEINRLSDSLGDVRAMMQEKMIEHASGMHGRLSPEERIRLYSRMIGKLDGDQRERHRRRDR